MAIGNWNLNKNLYLTHDEEFVGLPLMDAYAPFLVEYLDALYGVMCKALGAYARVFAFRCDLRLPQGAEASGEEFRNEMVSKFIASFKAKIRHNRESAASTGRQVHDTDVRYFWVREVGCTGRVHYHCVFLLNADAFRWLGNRDYQSPNTNMAKRVMEAWASALGMPVEAAEGLVHFPSNPTYVLRRDDPASLKNFFWRASYLCKAETKHYGHGHHGYGCSRT